MRTVRSMQLYACLERSGSVCNYEEDAARITESYSCAASAGAGTPRTLRPPRMVRQPGDFSTGYVIY